jgi:hypothetical protein
MIIHVASNLLLKVSGSRTINLDADFVRYSIEEDLFECLYKRS